MVERRPKWQLVVDPGPPQHETGLGHAFLACIGASPERAHRSGVKMRAMLRRLLSLLLMFCLATGAAASGCPMAAATKAAAETSAPADMADCPHARTAQADTDTGTAKDAGKAGCDHCKQCRVQVPPVDVATVPPSAASAQALAGEIPSPPPRVSAPLLRPPISSSPAHFA